MITIVLWLSLEGKPMASAFWKQLFMIICILTAARFAAAQDSVNQSSATGAPRVSGRSADVGTIDLGIWIGYSDTNPQFMGRTTNRSLFELNMQYARVFKAGESWALKYTAEIVPVAIVNQPQQVEMNGSPVDSPNVKENIYGFGVTPVGLQLNFGRGHVFQPYVNGTAGFLYFEDQVPVKGSSKFNFTLGLGAGLQIWHSQNQSFLFGYKYHHISNGYTAPKNPGMDSNLFYLGYVWTWRQ